MKTLEYKVLVRFVILGFFFLSNKVLCADLSVTPLYFEFERSKQKSEKFKIQVGASDATEIRVSPYIATQDISGKLAFVEDPGQSLIKLKKEKYVFNRKEKKFIEGEIIFPEKVNKTFVYALMIEEIKGKADKGIAIKVRYAVVLKVSTDDRRVLEKGKMDEIQLKSVSNKMILQGRFENQTVKDYYVNSIAYIRNKNGKLVQKINLRSASSIQKGIADSIIFPSAKVNLAGKLSTNLPIGKYQVTIINKLNNKRQVVTKQSLNITPELLKSLGIEKVKKEVKINPAPIKMKLKTGVTGFYRVEVINYSDDARKINLPEIFADNDESKGYIKFTPKKLELKSGQKKYLLVKIKNNTDKEWQPKEVVFKVNDNSDKLAQTIKVPVTLEY